ncbi:MAG TPA: ABC transporter ATP-binding protein [Vicinamibacterales bacterium]|jgi:iron(III) transport system ATP-binding protein|nr:ABC transporter ATP-binding protein [Vicinamibacterales bacterium]
MIPVTVQAITKVFPHRGTVVDSVNLRIEGGEFFTLLGPSGCGKSTLLRLIGGFEEPTGGRIMFDDREVTHEPPNRRGIGFVFQNYALFPHLTVAENVAFGLRVRKIGRRDVAARVRQALEDVRLDHCAAERVDRLSGGQQQRVALARALVIRPGLLLLDEPLSNLDATLRQEARSLLRGIHRTSGASVIYVTHDQSEAMVMSDRIAILQRGQVHQVGAPEAIYHRPATKFVADFVGRNNILEAVVCGMQDGQAILRFDHGTRMRIDPSRSGPNVDVRPGARLGVCVRPESFQIRNAEGMFAGIVSAVEYTGPLSVCEVNTPLGTLHVDVPSSCRLPSTGERIHLSMDASALHLIQMERPL